MLNVDDAVATHWPQGKVKILVYIFRECLQTHEIKKWEDIKDTDRTIANSLREQA